MFNIQGVRYIQISQPTTCFVLFYLGHLQIVYLSHRKCKIVLKTIEVRGDEISFTKIGRLYKLVVLKYALFTLVCCNIFVHYWSVSEGPEWLWVPALFGRVAVCHSGPLLWPCVLSKLYPVAAVGVLLWRRVTLWCWYVRRASGVCGLIRITLI